MEERSCQLQALIIFGIVAHLIILTNAQNATLIAQTCSRTPNYNLCVSTLNSNPKTRDAKDMRDVAMIMMSYINDPAAKAQSDISGLLLNRGIYGSTRDNLAKCYDGYAYIIGSALDEITDSLYARSYEEARNMMGVVITKVNNCEQSFKVPIVRGGKYPISDDTKTMLDYSNIASAIISILK